ncbi:MAG: hypothetical protein U9Q30_07340 [Campylobacterota bacterium]|nr:hypothetical protein [Campylobacterota bacterium]
MKKFNYLLISSIAVSLFINSCSSRQYFEPKSVDENYTAKIEELDFNIIDFRVDSAILENYKYITKDGISKESLENNFRFLNQNNSTVLASDRNNTLLIKDNDKVNKIRFNSNIISASSNEKYIALSFIDNSISLYDRDSNKTVFKEYIKESLLNDTKIANPIFLNSLIMYPTLDGKIIILDIETKKISNILNLDPENNINNIIILSTIGDTLVSATSTKIFSFVSGRLNQKDFNIKQIMIESEYIYLVTLEGLIVKLDKNLKEISSQKFKFANFHTLGNSKEYIYSLESQGYIVRLDKDLNSSKVMGFEFDNEEKSISIGDKLYYEDKVIELK